jgi:hypothetical protein
MLKSLKNTKKYFTHGTIPFYVLSLLHSLMVSISIPHELINNTIHEDMYALSMLYFLFTSTYFNFRHPLLYHHIVSIIAITMMINRPENTAGRLIYTSIEIGNLLLYPVNILYKFDPRWDTFKYLINNKMCRIRTNRVFILQFVWYTLFRIIMPLYIMSYNSWYCGIAHYNKRCIEQQFSTTEKMVIYILILGSIIWSIKLFCKLFL